MFSFKTGFVTFIIGAATFGCASAGPDDGNLPSADEKVAVAESMGYPSSTEGAGAEGEPQLGTVRQALLNDPSERPDWNQNVVTVWPGSYGNWTEWVYCNVNTYARRFKIQVEGPRGSGDDTAMNGISLWCEDHKKLGGNELKVSGPWGVFADNFAQCTNSTKGLNNNFMTGGEMKVEGSQGSGDDTSANSFRAVCEEGKVIEVTNGGGWGSWRGAKTCPVGEVVCGVRAKIEPSQGSGDDTGLNGIEFACCDDWVKEEWKCPSNWFGMSDGCDCGCGAPDPDCGSTPGGACIAPGCNVASCNYSWSTYQ